MLFTVFRAMSPVAVPGSNNIPKTLRPLTMCQEPLSKHSTHETTNDLVVFGSWRVFCKWIPKSLESSLSMFVT